MPEIKLEHVTKRWGKFYAVEDLNLTIADNSFVTLLGPSGCGKTTTLRMIAGLETPTSGRITIGNQVVFDSAMGINVPANKRRVGFLFQNYALWPNMTVYQNISFGLSNIKEPLAKVDFETKNAARLAQILKNPADVTAVLEECRAKDGKLEEKKAILKLLAAFTVSQYTAKTLFGYHLEKNTDCAGEIAKLEAKVAAGRKAASDAGLTLDGEFRFCKDGEAVMQTRKLTKEEYSYSTSRNLIRPKPERKRYRRWTMRKLLLYGPKPTPGYYIVPESIRSGTNRYTGYSYMRYTEEKLDRRI